MPGALLPLKCAMKSGLITVHGIAHPDLTSSKVSEIARGKDLEVTSVAV